MIWKVLYREEELWIATEILRSPGKRTYYHSVVKSQVGTDISPTLGESKPADTQRELAKISGVGHDTVVSEEGWTQEKTAKEKGMVYFNR